MKRTIEELAEKFKGYKNPKSESVKESVKDTCCNKKPTTCCGEYCKKENIDRPNVTYDWDKEHRRIVIHFGKNGMGLTDEFTQIGKFVEKLSETAYVFIENAFVDGLDDVYDIVLRYHYK